MKKNLLLLGIILIAVFTSCKKPKITCEIINPLPNTTFELGETIDLSVVANAENASISTVQIYLDGAGYQSKSFFPFNFQIYTNDLKVGQHTIRAVAISNNDLKCEETISFNLIKYESPDFVSFSDGKWPKGWNREGWYVTSPGFDDNYAIMTNLYYYYYNTVSAIKTCDENINCIEFYAKNNIENEYYPTKLGFYMDNVLKENITLTTTWEKYTFDIPFGEHIFSWRRTSGVEDDDVYIDAIKFFKK